MCGSEGVKKARSLIACGFEGLFEFADSLWIVALIGEDAAEVEVCERQTAIGSNCAAIESGGSIPGTALFDDGPEAIDCFGLARIGGNGGFKGFLSFRETFLLCAEDTEVVVGIRVLWFESNRTAIRCFGLLWLI